ncbi:MAG: hypothetical protein ACYC3W_10630 [Candidatus Nanopelagicales bacterium]
MIDDLMSLWGKERNLVSSIRDYIKRNDPNCEIVYIPNLIPKKKVDYIFVAMEPSFGTWARTEFEAQKKIDAGFKNFIDSWDVMAFHYCASNYLSQSYYITDISKAAMKVKNADKYRDWIYQKWSVLLKEEIEIVGNKRCRLVPVGFKAKLFIKEVLPNYSILDDILHYSGTASRHRNRLPAIYPQEYIYYTERLNQKCLVNSANIIINDQNIPHSTLRGLKNGLLGKVPTITESRKKLMFTYYTMFNEIRTSM